MSKEDKIVEDAPFEVPAFDEKEFIRKELISFRTTLVLFLFSIAVAGISFAIWKVGPALRFPIQILIALTLGASLLRLLFRMAGIDVSHWKRKEWVGQVLLFFIFWIGFFLLFTNPPVTDASPPRLEVAFSPAVQAPGHPIQLGAYISDNVGLGADGPTFCVLHSGPGQPLPSFPIGTSDTGCGAPWGRVGGVPFWTTNVTAPGDGNLTWYVRALDKNGQAVEATGTIPLSSPFEFVDPPRDGKFVRHDDTFTVKVRSELLRNIRAAQFSLDGGVTFHSFAKHPDPTKAKDGWWTTDPTYEGWTASNHQVTLRVLDQPTFLRAPQERVGGLAAHDPGGPYNVTVAAELQGIGEMKEPAVPERAFQAVGQTPGLGFAPAVGTVAAVAILAGRRRTDA